MASGADRVTASFVASPDQRSTSDLMRASQARLACSHASSNSFCTPSIASVCSGPNFAKGVEASVGLAVMTSLRSSLLMFDLPPTASLYNLLLAPARSCDPLQDILVAMPEGCPTTQSLPESVPRYKNNGLARTK